MPFWLSLSLLILAGLVVLAIGDYVSIVKGPQWAAEAEEKKQMITRTRDAEQLASMLTVALELDGGATLSTTYGPDPVDGWCVGVAGRGLVMPELDRDALAEWLQGARTATGYVGIWRDPNTGTIYADVVRVMFERGAAVDLAASTGELAIFNLRTGETVQTQPINA